MPLSSESGSAATSLTATSCPASASQTKASAPASASGPSPARPCRRSSAAAMRSSRLSALLTSLFMRLLLALGTVAIGGNRAIVPQLRVEKRRASPSKNELQRSLHFQPDTAHPAVWYLLFP